MNKRIISCILAVMLMVGVLAGCNTTGNTNGTGDPTPSGTAANNSDGVGTTNPTGNNSSENGNTSSESQESTTPIIPADPNKSYSDVYDSLLCELSKYIRSVTKAPEKTEEMEGTIGITEIAKGISETEALKSIGYVVEDINADHYPELLIYSTDNNGKSTGSTLLAAYTYNGKSPALFLNGMSKNKYYILNDGLIYNENTFVENHIIFGTLTLPANTAQLSVKDYYFTYQDDNDKTGYFHNQNGVFDPAESEKFKGTEKDFTQTKSDLSKNIKSSELTLFETIIVPPETTVATSTPAETTTPN